MRRRGAAVFIAIGCFCMIAAFALGGYNLWDDHRAAQSVSDILARLPMREPSDLNITPDYILNPDMEMPAEETDGYLYIGRLTIPSLGLELPVMDTWDYTRMKIAPCRYAGTAYRSGFVICAHNYTSHFGRLKNLSPGDRVYFTDMAGDAFSYEVAAVETLGPAAVEEMKSEDWDLTLFSCTISGQARVTARCRQIRMQDGSGR